MCLVLDLTKKTYPAFLSSVVFHRVVLFPTQKIEKPTTQGILLSTPPCRTQEYTTSINVITFLFNRVVK